MKTRTAVIFLAVAVAVVASVGSAQAQTFTDGIVTAKVAVGEAIPPAVPGSPALTTYTIGVSILTTDPLAVAFTVNISLQDLNGKVVSFHRTVDAVGIATIPTYLEFRVPAGSPGLTKVTRLQVSRLHAEVADDLTLSIVE